MILVFMVINIMILIVLFSDTGRPAFETKGILWFSCRYVIDAVSSVSADTRGHKGQLAPHCHALSTMIKNSYHGNRRLSTRLGSKTLNTSLGLGGNQN